ncbi:MAG: hypothetical protein GBAus27B_000310 [Mycoplasmataceae bacterium]|nr:MAG: hypothetical protein GBAus27B_000310 [Mycoplasmataceae bacterium]
MYVIREKPNIWKSLLLNLAFSNLIMIVVWAIQIAFGYQPHYLMSLVITNAISLIFWGLRNFGDSW